MPETGIEREADLLELQIPPAPEYVITARLFVAAAGRHLGLDEESVADLKLAVSEASTQAIEAHRRASLEEPVTISLLPSATTLDVSVTASAGLPRPPGDPAPDLALTPTSIGRALSNALIHSLFPDADVSVGNGGMAVRFSLPLPERETP